MKNWPKKNRVLAAVTSTTNTLYTTPGGMVNLIMPQLPVKIKGGTMDIQGNLLELETAAQRISDGLSAIQVMVIGLDGAGSEYAGAFHAIWDYLSDADLEFQKCLKRCLSTP